MCCKRSLSFRSFSLAAAWIKCENGTFFKSNANGESIRSRRVEQYTTIYLTQRITISFSFQVLFFVLIQSICDSQTMRKSNGMVGYRYATQLHTVVVFKSNFICSGNFTIHRLNWANWSFCDHSNNASPFFSSIYFSICRYLYGGSCTRRIDLSCIHYARIESHQNYCNRICWSVFVCAETSFLFLLSIVFFRGEKVNRMCVCLCALCFAWQLQSVMHSNPNELTASPSESEEKPTK